MSWQTALLTFREFVLDRVKTEAVRLLAEWRDMLVAQWRII